MKILSLETSTEFCSVALWLDGQVTERFERVGQKHSEHLIPMLDGLLSEAGYSLTQLDGIAFGKGPGSFTGVRIACGVTQGLALGADLPVLGICTLEALAEASGHERVIATLDARMGELYHAAYVRMQADWQVVRSPSLCKPELAPMVESVGWYGVGSGYAEHGDILRSRYQGVISEVDAQVVPRAGAIAVLGAAGFARGDAVDAALALPLYLRDKVALKTSERV